MAIGQGFHEAGLGHQPLVLFPEPLTLTFLGKSDLDQNRMHLMLETSKTGPFPLVPQFKSLQSCVLSL